jgi:predicted HAD superfamily phosphohydrolase YqeG
LHAFLTQYLDRVNVIGDSISADFLVANWLKIHLVLAASF